MRLLIKFIGIIFVVALLCIPIVGIVVAVCLGVNASEKLLDIEDPLSLEGTGCIAIALVLQFFLSWSVCNILLKLFINA